MMIKLYNDDCIKKFATMPRNKVDAIITDPPYGVSRKHQLGYSNMGRSGMNYGEWDYNFDYYLLNYFSFTILFNLVLYLSLVLALITPLEAALSMLLIASFNLI